MKIVEYVRAHTLTHIYIRPPATGMCVRQTNACEQYG